MPPTARFIPRLLFAVIPTLLSAAAVFASAAGQGRVLLPDNGDGTYTNPVMWGDWPDPDIIRVDDDFYFVSTSMHYVPGCPIAKSKDLVNWEMAGYAVARYDEDPAYDMKGGKSAYLQGSWAATIRHHDGLFYVGFCTPGGNGKPGRFSMCTAKDVRGPWTRTIFPEYLYDPGLLFDDDGKVYVAHGQSRIRITELNADALSVKKPAVDVFERKDYPYLEGSHFYKIDGLYYILGSTGGTTGRQVCLRSKNVYGPYESKVIIDDQSTYPGNGLHQGGMVRLKDGSWWFMIMQDRGPIGRTPNLEPVTWVDGWPMLGKNGRGVVTHAKPLATPGLARTAPATSDDFASPKLGLQWQWNHNPDDTRWSLTAKPGALRLVSGHAKNLMRARNTLTQRVQGPASEVCVELDFGDLRDGDIAGLGVFQKPYAFIAVNRTADGSDLIMVNDGKTIATVSRLKGRTIRLKAKVAEKDFKASFQYAAEDGAWRDLGEPMTMGLGLAWTANRFALFNFNTKNDGGGAADFRRFKYNAP